MSDWSEVTQQEPTVPFWWGLIHAAGIRWSTPGPGSLSSVSSVTDLFQPPTGHLFWINLSDLVTPRRLPALVFSQFIKKKNFVLIIILKIHCLSFFSEEAGKLVGTF